MGEILAHEPEPSAGDRPDRQFCSGAPVGFLRLAVVRRARSSDLADRTQTLGSSWCDDSR
jgi:hypothetical protein